MFRFRARQTGRGLALVRESLAARRALGSRLGIAESLEALALVEAPAGPERAARLLGAAGALREAIGAPLPPAERAQQERAAAGARAGLGEAAFTAAMVVGRALPLDEVIAVALAATGSAPPRRSPDSW